MSLRRLILDNFWWKLLSLLLAAFTWLTVNAGFQRDQGLRENPVETSSKRFFPSLPITLLTSPLNLNYFKVSPPTADVTVSGSEENLKKLQERDLHVYVDLTTVGDEKQFHGKVLTQCPSDVKVTLLSPSRVIIERIDVTRQPVSISNQP
jgi:YbbR domain-containing protein